MTRPGASRPESIHPGAPLQRVIVMGPPGSGKSTLARQIGARHDLPVFHLDQAYHRPGWQPAEEDAFRAEVERLAAQPRWIIDGNYTATLEPRLRAADTLIYLDLPTWLIVPRVVRRILTSHGRVRPDMAAGCPERWDPAFLRFVCTWNRDRRARNLERIRRFDGRLVVLRSGAEQRRCAAVLTPR